MTRIARRSIQISILRDTSIEILDGAYASHRIRSCCRYQKKRLCRFSLFIVAASNVAQRIFHAGKVRIEIRC